MRRVWILLAATAMIVGVPLMALADNQQIAEQIAAHLRDSGQLHGYKIGVKFQEGTAWLRGRVASEDQMRLALQLAAQVPGVQRVENELTVAPQQTGSSSLTGNSPLGKLMNPFGSTGVKTASADIPAPVLQQGTSAMGPEQTQTPRPMGLSSLGVPRTGGIARVSALETSPMLATPEQAAPTEKHYAAVPAMMLGPEETPSAGTPTPLQPMPMSPQSVARLPMPQGVARPVPSPRMAYREPTPRPIPIAMAPAVSGAPVPTQPMAGSPVPVSGMPASGAVAPVRYDQPHLPNYAWPSYAAYPNYAAVTYPKQYSPTAWPYIGPFYPYPQVPLGWRKVTLEWRDGWWFMDFDDGVAARPFNGLFRCK